MSTTLALFIIASFYIIMKVGVEGAFKKLAEEAEIEHRKIQS